MVLSVKVLCVSKWTFAKSLWVIPALHARFSSFEEHTEGCVTSIKAKGPKITIKRFPQIYISNWYSLSKQKELKEFYCVKISRINKRKSPSGIEHILHTSFNIVLNSTETNSYITNNV